MDRLGAFEQLLLLALARLGDDTDGVPIRDEIETRTGRLVSPGAVYTALDRARAARPGPLADRRPDANWSANLTGSDQPERLQAGPHAPHGRHLARRHPR